MNGCGDDSVKSGDCGSDAGSSRVSFIAHLLSPALVLGVDEFLHSYFLRVREAKRRVRQLVIFSLPQPGPPLPVPSSGRRACPRKPPYGSDSRAPLKYG